MSDEPEYITIVEGPTPQFQLAPALWNESIYEGRRLGGVALVELRTMNGEDIRRRCLRAWSDGRAVQLDYPDDMRERQYVDVVAMRLVHVDAGTVLRLWVHLPLDEEEYMTDTEGGILDDDDDEFSD